MNILHNRSIRFKIIVPPLLVAVGFLFLSLLLIYRQNRITTIHNQVSRSIFSQMLQIDDLIILSEQVNADILDITIASLTNQRPSTLDMLQDRLENHLSELNIDLGQIFTYLDPDRQEKKLLLEMRPSLESFEKMSRQATAIVRNNPVMGALMMSSTDAEYRVFYDVLMQYRDYEKERSLNEEQSIFQTLQANQLMISGLAYLLTLAGLLTMIFISSRQIAAPLRDLTGKMKRLSAGDLEVEVENTLRKDEIGEISRTLESFRRSLREKEKLDSKLVESERRLSTLIDNLPGVVYRCKYDRDWTMLYFNEGIETLSGYKPDDFLVDRTLSYDALIHSKDRKRVRKLVEKGIDDENSFEIEYRIVTKSGAVKWVWERGKGVPETDGTIQFLEGVITDITDRRRIEDERNDLLKDLENKNNELESYIYAISHDLRSPLVSLGGFAWNLQHKYKENLDEKGTHYIERIQSNVTHMENLLNKLLELSRIGRLAEERQKIDMNDFLAEILATLEGRIELTGTKIAISPSLPIVFADRTRLSQVFVNLIENAIKFKKADSFPSIEIGCIEEKKFFRFYIKDDGIGLDPKYAKRIFLPFQKLDSGSDGIGVGLAITSRIVEQYCGKMSVESQPGTGSTFFLTLPKEDL
jgi:PAS domain S-box-containing protein